MSSMASMPSSAYLSSSASSTARACVAVLGEVRSRLRTFSARSRRVSGGWSKATWQIRSNGSRSLADAPSASASKKHALLQQLVDDGLLAVGRRSSVFRKASSDGELARGSRSSGVVLQRLGDELAVLVVVLDPLGDDGDGHVADDVLDACRRLGRRPALVDRIGAVRIGASASPRIASARVARVGGRSSASSSGGAIGSSPSGS